MKTIKDIVIELRWLILFGVLVIVSICMYRIADKYIFINIPEEILKYCETSYPNSNFKFVEFKSGSNSIQGKTAVVEDSSGNRFSLTRQYLEDGTLEYTDTYIGVLCKEYINNNLVVNMPSSATYSILIEDSVFATSEKSNIDVADVVNNLDTVISITIKDDKTWSMEEVEKFCKALPFRVNVVLVSNGVQMNFSTTREFEVIYR